MARPLLFPMNMAPDKVEACFAQDIDIGRRLSRVQPCLATPNLLKGYTAKLVKAKHQQRTTNQSQPQPQVIRNEVYLGDRHQVVHTLYILATRYLSHPFLVNMRRHLSLFFFSSFVFSGQLRIRQQLRSIHLSSKVISKSSIQKETRVQLKQNSRPNKESTNNKHANNQDCKSRRISQR